MAKRRQLIKEELLRIATACFTQRGYNETTLDDIVSLVGISRVTFYTYFESKAALLTPETRPDGGAIMRSLQHVETHLTDVQQELATVSQQLRLNNDPSRA